MPTNFHNIYYVCSLIANLVSCNSLFKKSFYFYNGKYFLNRISNNQEIVYTSLASRLFALQIAYTPFITFFSQDFAFKWYWQLKHIGFNSLKKALKMRFLDFNKIALIKSCKTYTEAKHQCHLFYTVQQVPKDILDIIYTNVIGPIMPTNFNGCWYYLVLMDEYLCF